MRRFSPVSFVLALPSFVLIGLASTAATPTAAMAKPPAEVPTIQVTLRPERPLVTEIAKPTPTLEASAAKQTSVPKIAGAVQGAPF